MQRIKRTYRLRYYAKQAVVGTLMVVGFMALAGEPAEDANLLVCALLQLLTFVITWTIALYLYRRWEIGKEEHRIERINKARQ